MIRAPDKGGRKPPKLPVPPKGQPPKGPTPPPKSGPIVPPKSGPIVPPPRTGPIPPPKTGPIVPPRTGQIPPQDPRIYDGPRDVTANIRPEFPIGATAADVNGYGYTHIYRPPNQQFPVGAHDYIPNENGGVAGPRGGLVPPMPRIPTPQGDLDSYGFPKRDPRSPDTMYGGLAPQLSPQNAALQQEALLRMYASQQNGIQMRQPLPSNMQRTNY